MEKTIDARGQACPKPLVMARDTLKTLTQDDKLNVVVDNLVSAQNLEKMASQMNLPSQKVQQGTDYIVSLFVKKSMFIPQQEEIKCEVPTKTDNSFVVVLAYIEYCGFYIDKKSWENKCINDRVRLVESKQILDS